MFVVGCVGSGSVVGMGYALEVTTGTATLSLMVPSDWPTETGTANQRANECMIEKDAL